MSFLRSLSSFVLALGVVLAVLGAPRAAVADPGAPSDRPATVTWNPAWPRFRGAEVALTSALVLVVDAGLVAGGIHRSSDVSLQMMAMNLEAFAFTGAILAPAVSPESVGVTMAGTF